MSASAIIDGIITQLTATSCLGASMVATDYRVLDIASGSCGVIGWTRLRTQETAFGGKDDYVWGMLLEGYIKDTGDPHQTMRRTIEFIDMVASALDNDPTIQGTAVRIEEIRASRIPGIALQNSGGVPFLPMNIEIEVLEYNEG